MNHEPFDHEDPHDIACEMLRRGIIDLYKRADRVTVFRELNDGKQLSCWLSGTLVGIIGVAMCCIKEDGRDHLMQKIVDALPRCREYAEMMLTRKVQ